ncbi:MAG: glucoamylase family protein [Candidatus Saelkia tenebricola]|nr:glucoamylase family protein [Candidatus Saelkia tenebricola]
MFKEKFFKIILVLFFLAAIISTLFYKHLEVQKEKDRVQNAREEFLADLDTIPQVELPGIILLAHFNEKSNQGSGCSFGAWDKDPDDFTQNCFDSFSPLVKKGEKGYSLRIDYDVDSPNPAFNGIWFKLENKNLNDYRYLVLSAKGDKKRGFTKHFKLELKNTQGEKGIHYLTDLEDDWKQYVIPLNKFMGISEFDKMQELIFVFEDWRVTDKEGTIYIDDAYFTKEEILKQPLCGVYPTLRECIPKPDISTISDREFLELIQRKSFGYFWRETNPETGLTKDKANNFKKDNFKVASIAAVGFALTAYPVAVEKGWIRREEAMERVLNTLFFFRDRMENVHGFFYHFVGMDNGDRVWNCELSSIDTALFLAGALFAGEYFGCKVKELADEIYQRVEWDWMLGKGDNICMGWTPESGFLPDRWNKYGEQLIMYLLALGSPTHPITESVWYDVRRPIWDYEGYTCLSSPPMFTHQFSHIWVDFRNKHDDYADYFTSSVNATLANRQFCINNKENSLTFNKNSWGLTACESPAGYRAYGAPPGYAHYDGTVAFTAVGGSTPFAPAECISALRWMYQNHKDYIWGNYGFVDSFNRDKNWYSDVVIGIDQGPIMLMIENYLSGFVWEYFMRNEYIKKAMQIAGFKDGAIKLEADKKPVIVAQYADSSIEGQLYKLTPKQALEHGAITKYPYDLGCEYKASWDEENLYFWVKVSDNDVIAEEEAKTLYKNDCVELYIAPVGERLYWGNKEHFQLGFAPGRNSVAIKYAWFQERDIEEVKSISKLTKEGYELAITIPFSVLNVTPQTGAEINFSIAVNDFDRKDNTDKAKFNLHFVPIYKNSYQSGFELAVLKLAKDCKQID